MESPRVSAATPAAAQKKSAVHWVCLFSPPFCQGSHFPPVPTQADTKQAGIFPAPFHPPPGVALYLRAMHPADACHRIFLCNFAGLWLWL